jgi:hypothetical protein
VDEKSHSQALDRTAPLLGVHRNTLQLENAIRLFIESLPARRNPLSGPNRPTKILDSVARFVSEH